MSKEEAERQATIIAAFYHHLCELHVPKEFARDMTIAWVELTKATDKPKTTFSEGIFKPRDK